MFFSRLRCRFSLLKQDILSALMSVELSLAGHHPGIYRFLAITTRSHPHDEPELAQFIKDYVQPEYGEGICHLVWLRLHSRFKSLYRFQWFGFLQARVALNVTSEKAAKMIADAIRDNDFKEEIIHHLEWLHDRRIQQGFADCVRIEEGVW